MEAAKRRAIVGAVFGTLCRVKMGPGIFRGFAEDVTGKTHTGAPATNGSEDGGIGRLSGGIAHDFNNLLGVIIGYSGVLKKSLDKNQPTYEYATKIEKRATRCLVDPASCWLPADSRF